MTAVSRISELTHLLFALCNGKKPAVKVQGHFAESDGFQMEGTTAKILIIDDDDEVRYSLSRVLQTQNFEVVEAGSGEEGIAGRCAGTS